MNLKFGDKFSRVDNGRLQWFDVDLPDQIAVRRKVYEDRDRCVMLDGDALNGDWTKHLPASDMYIIAMEGVLEYFSKEHVKTCLNMLCDCFPHGYLLAHHVVGCAAEWIYIKSDHSEEGRKLTADFFGKSSAVMIGCYAGIILFSVAHFIPVVAGMTPLPSWACVFNLLPLFLVQAPFNIPGAGNIAGAVMYIGLFILFLF